MSVKVMVMDDSPFSRMMISEALSDSGYEVVGEAGTLEELLETYAACKPDIVTMDIAMPGADGFECSRELRIHDPKAKIILVSSMKDEETEAEAKRIGVSGYVQKPVDAETLIKVIKNIMSPDSLYEQLIERGLETFKEALAQNVTRMAKTPVNFTEIENSDEHYISQGITTVIGLIGQSTGSMIMDLSVESAEKIAEAILRRPAKSREEVLAMVSELANIIAGIACSMLNKKDKAFALRVSPPSLFHGNTAEIVSPSVKIKKSIAETDFGNIFLGVGFKKGVSIMDVNLINPVLSAFGEIIPQIGFQTIQKKNVSLVGPTFNYDGVLISLSVIGPIKGVIMIGMDIDSAKRFASKMMMGMEVPEFDTLAQSAVSEMGNMVCANACTQYSKIDIAGLDISPPVLMIGQGGQATLPVPQTIVIHFLADDIEIKVYIGLV